MTLGSPHALAKNPTAHGPSVQLKEAGLGLRVRRIFLA
jgi:hypothetical protein